MILLYDADCGFCTRSANWLVKQGCTVTLTPWQVADLAAMGITEADAAARLHLVDGTRVEVGHRAIATALASSPRLALRLAGRILFVSALDRPLSWAYDYLAKHRHQLPGGTPTCAIEGPQR
ncbi:MAG: DUF393 domain-containing protein [Marmoricola sp.]|jgi:predicted DCC family thiol-disulfide oxidoreductase YuxK